MSFFAVSIGWLATVMGAGQRLVIWPLVTLAPSRRTATMARWFHFNASAVMSIARVVAGVRVRVRGRIAPGACVVVMNHQSVLDVPLLYVLGADPLPVIPTRDRYRRGIPGISPLLRLAKFPLITQKRETAQQDLAAIAQAAEAVARGEASIAIYPEGHRTRDGEIGPFMPRGLTSILARAKRPVYCVVADGMWGARTMADAARQMAGAHVEAVVLGPFQPPEREEELGAFIEQLRGRMVAALADIRSGNDPLAE
ncbi:MAG TPA: lysophospholipid acyltransferase family protein [Longimicrobiaceae bacterium]|jgi:1-acyl-sn-glycerol-3-phosphate acyltransferase|nr:lysophospholipid acyltransferase family protein [Longimicrobiaceae bacterium]